MTYYGECFSWLAKVRAEGKDVDDEPNKEFLETFFSFKRGGTGTGIGLGIWIGKYFALHYVGVMTKVDELMDTYDVVRSVQREYGLERMTLFNTMNDPRLKVRTFADRHLLATMALGIVDVKGGDFVRGRIKLGEVYSQLEERIVIKYPTVSPFVDPRVIVPSIEPFKV